MSDRFGRMNADRRLLSAWGLGAVLFDASRDLRIAAKMRADGWDKVQSPSWAHAWYYGRQANIDALNALGVEMRRIYNECSIGGNPPAGEMI